MSTEMSLKDAVADLSEAFATMLLEAVGKASLGELADLANGGTSSAPARRGRPVGSTNKTSSKKSAKGKRVRRTVADLDAAASKIVAFVKKHKNGVSAETIREELGLERKELPRPIKHALSQRLISKKGQKRATLYFAGGKSSGGAKKSKPAKKASKKASKKGKRSVSTRSSNGANHVSAAAAPAAE